tara:strand:- start:4216 stop:5154 length:939 start_codon:yes stop_codon:yes gene_type:complete
MVRETRLSVDNLIAPLFLVEGEGVREAIHSMPGQYRMSIDTLLEEVGRLSALRIPGVALFPAIHDEVKDEVGTEGLNAEGLFPRAIRAVKEAYPDMLVVSDVALDPYSSDGHDGVVRDGVVVNDETLGILAQMAVVQAEAGADIVAPSDMMDGRVGVLRDALDEAGFTDVSILSYTAKYASALYGPFRDALDSAPRKREGIPEDKRTYQMDPCNVREALRETALDLDEGADMVMVKPAGMYLDVIRRVREVSDVPVAAYQVSGEYAMLHAAGQAGYLDLEAVAMESLIAIRRAGADIILTYFAADVAEWLAA